MIALLESPDNRVQGFLAAGHVCTVMGWEEYEPIAERYRVPIVVTGFEPVDILEGVLLAVTQLERGEARVENQYVRSVQRGGNLAARDLLRRIFTLVDRKWRGIGEIPASGLAIREEYSDFDAELRFGVQDIHANESPDCRAGDVLRGQLKPTDCPMFGTVCTPMHPLGAPMVSTEGACAAYFSAGRLRTAAAAGGVS
jgi:hydrogenase expression/formation protein HypD